MKLGILLLIIIKISFGYEVLKKESSPETLKFKVILDSRRPENVDSTFSFYARIPSASQILKRYMDSVIKRIEIRQQQVEQERRDRIYRIYLVRQNVLKDFLPLRYF